MFLEGWFKRGRSKMHSWKAECVEIHDECIRVNVGGTDQLKWPRCSTALRQVSAFDEYRAWIDDSTFERGQVW